MSLNRPKGNKSKSIAKTEPLRTIAEREPMCCLARQLRRGLVVPPLNSGCSDDHNHQRAVAEWLTLEVLLENQKALQTFCLRAVKGDWGKGAEKGKRGRGRTQERQAKPLRIRI